MTITNINSRSARQKLNLINIFLEKQKPDIVCICEHWFEPLEAEYFLLEQYICCSAFFRSEGKGGGTSIFIRNGSNFVANNIHLCIEAIEQVFEYCACKLTINHHKYLIISIYHSPKANNALFIEKLEELIQKVYNNYTYIVICGDFNIDTGIESTSSKQLLDLFESYNLHPTVTEPTRITNTSSTHLDNIICNIPYTNTTLEEILFSDHKAIHMTFFNGAETSETHWYTWRRDINSTNEREFHYLLNKANWNEVYNSVTVDQKYDTFLSTFKLCFDIAFPKKMKKK